MAKKDKEKKETPTPEEEVTPTEETVEESAPEVNEWEEKYNAQYDSYLRLAADYDNYRKRTAKEKDAAYGNGKADAVEKLLPVYDEAYKKGVEMTMTQLVGILNSLGVEIFGNVGDTFDPNLHNAVMHTEDENLGENTISQVFQKGFKLGEKIVRFAMVQVAN